MINEYYAEVIEDRNYPENLRNPQEFAMHQLMTGNLVTELGVLGTGLSSELNFKI